jgi:hypothetical protein
MKDPVFIQRIIQRINEADERVKDKFSGLTHAQLNWKPSPESWSIGQCLDHLIISDCTYFPVLRSIMNKQYEMSRWEKWSPFSGFLGKMLANQLQENAVKKLNAPRMFLPAESNIDPGVLDRFHKHLDTLRNCITGCQHADLDKTHITSPAIKFVTFSLRNAITILAQHEHRHINQAISVKNAKQFPE